MHGNSNIKLRMYITCSMSFSSWYINSCIYFISCFFFVIFLSAGIATSICKHIISFYNCYSYICHNFCVFLPLDSTPQLLGHIHILIRGICVCVCVCVWIYYYYYYGSYSQKIRYKKMKAFVQIRLSVFRTWNFVVLSVNLNMKCIHLLFHCFYSTLWKRKRSNWKFTSISWCIYLKVHVLWRSLSDAFPMDYLMCYGSVRNSVCVYVYVLVCFCIACVFLFVFVCFFSCTLSLFTEERILQALREEFCNFFFPCIHFKRRAYLSIHNTLVLKHIIQGINSLLYINVMLSAQEVQTHSYEVSWPGVLVVLSRNSISTFSSNICTLFSKLIILPYYRQCRSPIWGSFTLQTFYSGEYAPWWSVNMSEFEPQKRENIPSHVEVPNTIPLSCCP